MRGDENNVLLMIDIEFVTQKERRSKTAALSQWQPRRPGMR